MTDQELLRAILNRSKFGKLAEAFVFAALAERVASLVHFDARRVREGTRLLERLDEQAAGVKAPAGYSFERTPEVCRALVLDELAQEIRGLLEGHFPPVVCNRCGAVVAADACTGDPQPPKCGGCRHVLSHGRCPVCDRKAWLEVVGGAR